MGLTLSSAADRPAPGVGAALRLPTDVANSFSPSPAKKPHRHHHGNQIRIEGIVKNVTMRSVDLDQYHLSK
jgi:hypothetical protein